MALLQLRQITLKYSSAPLLDKVDFLVDAGERICLLGRNGAGKTSLMRIITGEETPNEGEIIIPKEAVVTRLIQEVPDDITGTVMQVLHSGLRPDRHEEEWQTDVRLEDLAVEMQLPANLEFSELSGGLKRRVLLARALAGQPDILLLDEPTNHLDLNSILWLERFLLDSRTTLFFVTHAHCRARPWPAHELGLRLRHLSCTQGGESRGGGKAVGRLRQKTRAGRGLVASGSEGAPDAERRPRARPAKDAPRAEPTPPTRRHRPH
jgi:ABC-type Mn2+/Zn2+ transport system ATPase subunit